MSEQPNYDDSGKMHLPGSAAEKGKSAGLFVILCGLATTAITLFLVFLMNKAEIQPMGFYIFFIIPVGAILIGIAAGSGYGIGSWMSGAKIGGGLLILVVALQVVAYFASQFVEFQMIKDQLVAPMSFMSYFDATTRSFAFNNGIPLGMWGYAVRLLELGGFAGGGMIIPSIMMARPYCDGCQTYKKSKAICMMPAGVIPRRIKKKDTEGHEAMEQELQQALEGGTQLIDETADMALAGQTDAFVEMITQFKANKKDINKQTTRVEMTLQRCPTCFEGTLVYKSQSGYGEDVVVEEVAAVDVPAQFVRELLPRI